MSKLATRGEGNSQAKLTEADVRTIRQWYKNGIFMWFLSEQFEISQTQIWRIIHRVDWKHVRD